VLISCVRYIVYTSLFNMVDYLGMVIPLHSEVDPKLDPIDKYFKPVNARDAEVQAQCENSLYLILLIYTLLTTR
jgi:hypothetical protein